MLNLVLGRSGSGKTTYLRNILGNAAKGGDNRLLYIVPEQYSYSCERALLETLGSIDAQNIEVLSFSRLSDFVNRKVGGIYGVKLEDSDKIILMTHALNGIQDNLNFYKLQADKTYFARDLISLYSEFQKECISLDMLKEAMTKTNNLTLRAKLTDLALIFNEYASLLELNEYTDADLITTKLIDTLRHNNIFSDYTICIDAFKGFTGQEFQIISSLMNQTDKLYISICMDEKYMDNSVDDHSMIFGAVRDTISTLSSYAKSNNIEINTIFCNGHRTEDPALLFVEENIFSSDKSKYENTTDSITLYAADTLYDECNFIAAKVRKFMREDGIRLRDIAIVTRNIDAYKNELVAALNRFEVPVFEDSRQPIASQPLIILCKSLLSIISHAKLSTKDILSYLKTGFSPLSETEAAEIENYAFTWNIKEDDWTRDFVYNPDGISPDKNEEKLQELNEWRRTLMEPILELRSVCDDDCKAKSLDICQAFYKFLSKSFVRDALLEHAKYLESTGFSDLAAEQNRIWELLMDILTKLSVIQGTDTISTSLFADIFMAVIDMTTLGTIPHGLDEITIGSADRIRLSSPKIVFVCGCVEGEFPQNITSSNLLTNSDRKVMSNDLGLGLSPSNELVACDERFIAYQAITASTDKLIVSYHKKTGASEALSPSCIYTDIKDRFTVDEDCKLNLITSSMLDEYFFAETDASVFREYASGYHSANDDNAIIYNTLKSTIEKSGNNLDKLEILDSVARHEPHHITDDDLSRKLFGNNIGLSPSRVETFFSCPFQYFCRYGLKIYPRRRAEFSSQLNGTVVHYAFEKMLQEYSKEEFENISDEELLKKSKEYLDQYLIESFGNNQYDDPKFKYTYKQAIQNVVDIAKRLRAEFKVSEFVPVGFEHTVTDSIAAPDCNIFIKGDVDRIDVYTAEDGTKYLRVVDYKTYVKEFRLDHVVAGLNMQMLIYLFALKKNGDFGAVTPASVLYYKAKSSSSTITDRETSEEQIAAAKLEKNLSSGIYLNEKDVLRAIENPGDRFYHFYNRNGDPTDSLVSLAELGKIEEKVNENLIQMAEMLHSGVIDACPAAYEGVIDGCTYCDYRDVCGFEAEKDPCRIIEKQSKSDIFSEKDGDDDE